MSFELAIRAGYAANKDNFCIALHSMDDEDPYSIILIYNDRRPMPWNRIDVNRNIYDIAYIAFEEKFVALTDEGEVYFISAEGDISLETINGAGLNAKHSNGRGATMKICVVGDTLFVVGLGGQFFQRIEKAKWSLIGLPKLDAGFQDIDYLDVGGVNINDLYVVGVANPHETNDESNLILRSAQARIDGDEALAKKLYSEFYDNIQDSQGVAFYYDGDEWDEVDLYDTMVDTIYALSSEKLFFGTKNSGIFFGNHEDGFDDIDTAKNVRSITKLGKEIVFIAGSGLFTFTDKENAEVKPLKIKAPKGKAPVPIRVQAIDDVIICFDFNLDVYIWDGKDEWTHIPIPKELRNR